MTSPTDLAAQYAELEPDRFAVPDRAAQVERLAQARRRLRPAARG
jgi:hypothetical protein